MTPKEKAMELVEQFPYSMKESKDYALIVVNEIIKIEKHHIHDLWVEYWQKVKTEIENL